MQLRRTSLVLAIFFVITCSCGAQDLNIRICNKGEVPVYVAMASVGGLLNKIKIDGWYKIEPKATWGCPLFYRGTTRRTYYFAFAQVDDKGRKGIVTYNPSRSDDGHSAELIFFPVLKEGSFEKEGYRSEMQHAGLGEKLIPFSWSVQRSGDYDRNYDMSIQLKPSALDPVSMYLSDDEKPSTVGAEKKETPKEPKKEEIIPDTNYPISKNKLARKCFDYHRPLKDDVDPAVLAYWSNCVADNIIVSTELTNRNKNDLQEKGFGIISTNIKKGPEIMGKIYNSCKLY
jgi:hypothetical protein